MNEELLKLIVDNYQGRAVSGNFSENDVNESIRQQMIALNGGSEKITNKSFRDHPQMFSLLEQAITKTVVEGLDENNPLLEYVETRNLAKGDQQYFKITDNSTYVVSTIADGTQALRRQRLKGVEEVKINTKIRGLKIYDELSRVMAGRIDWNEFIAKVSVAFNKKIYADEYDAVVAAFDKAVTPYKQTGTFDEGKMTTLIDHIEATTGKPATIIGSTQAIRKMTGITGADANSAKEDLYNLGYFGKFHTTPIMALQNMHKVGSTDFILPENKIFVAASDGQPVKLVIEGDTNIIETSSGTNQDLSVEYLLTEAYGLGIIFSDNGFGEYDME